MLFASVCVWAKRVNAVKCHSLALARWIPRVLNVDEIQFQECVALDASLTSSATIHTKTRIRYPSLGTVFKLNPMLAPSHQFPHQIPEFLSARIDNNYLLSSFRIFERKTRGQDSAHVDVEDWSSSFIHWRRLQNTMDKENREKNGPQTNRSNAFNVHEFAFRRRTSVCKKENSFFKKSCAARSMRRTKIVDGRNRDGKRNVGNFVGNLLSVSPIEAVDQPDNFSILKAGGMAYGATSFQTLTQNCFYSIEFFFLFGSFARSSLLHSFAAAASTYLFILFHTLAHSHAPYCRG